MYGSRIVWGVLVGLATCGVGCCKTPKPQAFNVEVSASEQLADTTSRVHLVAVSDAERSDWADKDMTEYWRPKDPLRSYAMSVGIIHEMDFGAGTMRDVLPKSSPQWSTWMKNEAAWLFVLADVHGDHLEDRRVILPLDRCRWERGTDTLRIELYPGIVKATTFPKPEAAK